MDCTVKCPFLGHYLTNEQSNSTTENSTSNKTNDSAESFVKVEDVTSDGSTAGTYFEKVQTTENNTCTNVSLLNETSEGNGAEHQIQPSNKCLIENKRTYNRAAVLANKESELLSLPIGNVFYARGWRSQLCLCSKCRAMYQQSNVQFLIEDPEPDSEDDEEQGALEDKENNTVVSLPAPQISSLLPDLTSLMSVMKRKLNHVQQIEMAETLDNFREAFKEFVKPFAETGQVVTQEVRTNPSHDPIGN